MKTIWMMGLALSVAVGLNAFHGIVSEQEPAQARANATVTCGDGTIEVDDYGNASAFRIAGTDHLAPQEGHLQWVSVNNGPARRVDANNFFVAVETSVDQSGCPSSTLAYSAVIRNELDLVIEYYHYIVDYGMGFVSWYYIPVLYNFSDEAMSVCYYNYADPQLFGTPIDIGQYIGSDPETGLQAFRPWRDAEVPDQILAFRTWVPRNRWAQRPYPDLRDLIDGYPACTNLPNMQAQLTGDISNAFQYNRTIPPGESMTIFAEIGRVQ